ncbi:MAG: hypothetical protein A3C02_03790 [Candidatus Andersenbacteria bacterium RIFCSPHIGHO2_02_FULL_45_11]|uniref:DUF456 domain-containing protein n=1 Tax=Candidatus Andersenbacteria bacterium RIFCSPHIGHO2_12_FULL_45_11 TaxID=1797281 RepID=A0A1G1X5J4_9BACT|nr:MAG: hypothetical protein A2805_02975 [Candidatus Andersenbacteria bacterium RIFCSPHIGHO2_01_FULL_46_36]OGY32499.1 MAG: hypothetical protein A3C02_03790 [Candidatus Andersenbacteria bacterium RIFCSPHIGHO2_02_FULL_45_11]OGY35302.1 MAG: hypothetical protein A3D99_04405 [Candidatus Andersenbacteria bacterium RIFCSPHIGHO2_12_FULL_45_11]
MSILIIVITIILFLLGVLGTLIPALPGIGLVYAGILIYAFADHFTAIEVSTVVYLGIAALIASGAQYFGSVWAAKSAGGKKKALVGTFVGALFGTMAGPVGIFIGAFAGALVGALLEGSSPNTAARVAFQSMVGIIGGAIIQFLLSLALIAAFIIAVFF